MRPILSQLFTGLFLLLASQAFGLTMTTNFVITQPASPSPYAIGTKIVIELRVTDFTNIESMQFPITYNNVALKFDSLTNSAFSNWSAGNFVSNPGAGKIGISWDGFSNGANMPFSFPNGTAIFKLNFTVIGDGNGVVNISAAAAPPAVDVVGNGGQGIILNFQSGGTPNMILGNGVVLPPLVGFKIVANTIYIPQGERGCMPITVNDFDNIQSMQWALHWDNTVLNYECPRNFNLTGWSPNDFSPSPTTPATLLGIWADPAGVGVTKVDGARIVDVCFKAIGAPGSTSMITIDGNGFTAGGGSAEAINIALADVWTTGGPNGASGVSAPINIIVTTPPPTDVTYTVDTTGMAAPNGQACAAVRVKNFTNIRTSEFALSYNPLELTYTGPDLGANPLTLQASNLVANSGVVKFLWSSAAATTVANDAAIFSLCFNVIAPAGTKCNINFTSTACPTVTGIGTAMATGGVSMASKNGWIRSITSGPILTVSPHVSCFGGNNGAIQLTNPPSSTATGYMWAGPGITPNLQTQQSPIGLTAGTYTVTVTYTGGTTATNSTTITQPAAAVSQTNTVNTVSCYNGSNGAINLIPAGGTAPYTFLWSDGGVTTEDRTGLKVDIFTVTIKDSKNCSLGPIDITVSGFSQIALPAPVVTPVTCAGLSTGSIVIAPTGGAGGYTYKWSNNSTTKNLMGMPKGTYSVTITDQNGCTNAPAAGQNIAITEPQALVAGTPSHTDVKCLGTATGTGTLAMTGGTGTINYCWTTGSGPCADANALAAGTYTVIATDQNGCTSITSNIVIAPPPGGAMTVTAAGTSAQCFGQATGSIDLTVSGGWSNYTYAWSGANAQLPPVPDHNGSVPPGTYTVTVTDAGNCTSTKSVTVSGPQTDITPATDVQNVSCFGTANGSIDLNLSGGNGAPYSVTWSNTTLTGEAISTLLPNTYQPTVSDAQGCTKVLPGVVVTGPLLLLMDTTITAANPNNGAIDLIYMSGGTGNAANWTYSWTGPNGFVANTQDISGLAVGDYTVVIIDDNSCSRTFVYTVPSGNLLGGTAVDSVDNACNHDGCIHLNIPPAAASSFPLSLNWGFGSQSNVNTTTPSICSLGAGVYNITVTAANGNTIVLTGIQVLQNDPASVNINSTNPFDASHNGVITLSPFQGVQNPLSYQWGAPLNTTGPIVSNLDSGTYVVTITNQVSHCTSVQTIHLSRQYLPLVVTTAAISSPKCANLANGSIDLTVNGGNDPYVYLWSGPNGYTATTQDITGLMPGFYSATVTDFNDSIQVHTYTLTSQSNLAITNVNETSLYPSGDQVSGADVCDGAASVAFIPGVGNATIEWSNGITVANNTTLCGGAYSVTVTDAVGCTSVWSDALSAPVPIDLPRQINGVKCNGDCNGKAKVNMTGGAGPYSVAWSTGQTDPLVFANGFSQAVNLCGGDYTVTITDKNGAQKEFTVNVPEPPAVVTTFATTAPRNFNSCDGELLLETSGAVGPVTYVWSGSFGHTGNSERAINLCSGEFVQFIITDANGCSAYAADSVPYPEDGCFRVSPVITPGQQDGKNDIVVITCIETSIQDHIEIYNRWGQLVFQTQKGEHYSNSPGDHNWNGLTKSGEVLAEGVYYYVLTFTFLDDQGVEHEGTRKGAINLLR